MKANIQYPDPSVTLNSIFKRSEQYDCDTGIISQSHSYFHDDRYFLVGNKSNYEMKFISGNFYLRSI